MSDPLRLRLGLHRWLAGSREEAYSDWLAWVLEMLPTAAVAWRVLCDRALPAELAGEPVVVSREEWVPYGHPGATGRLDCVVRCGSWGTIVIEVKVVGADAADTVKGSGYFAWLGEQACSHKGAILISADGNSQADYQGFAILPWSSLTRRLREILPLLRSQKPDVASLVGAFVGAVEQNILGLADLTWLDRGDAALIALRTWSQTERTRIYLEEGDG